MIAIDRRGLQQEVGTVRFVVHVRISTGSDLAFQYAAELAAVFRSQRFAVATGFLETYANGPSTGLGGDVAYYMVSVSIPYRYLFTG